MSWWDKVKKVADRVTAVIPGAIVAFGVGALAGWAGTVGSFIKGSRNPEATGLFIMGAIAGLFAGPVLGIKAVWNGVTDGWKGIQTGIEDAWHFDFTAESRARRISTEKRDKESNEIWKAQQATSYAAKTQNSTLQQNQALDAEKRLAAEKERAARELPQKITFETNEELDIRGSNRRAIQKSTISSGESFADIGDGRIKISGKDPLNAINNSGVTDLTWTVKFPATSTRAEIEKFLNDASEKNISITSITYKGGKVDLTDGKLPVDFNNRPSVSTPAADLAAASSERKSSVDQGVTSNDDVSRTRKDSNTPRF